MINSGFYEIKQSKGCRQRKQGSKDTQRLHSAKGKINGDNERLGDGNAEVAGRVEMESFIGERRMQEDGSDVEGKDWERKGRKG